VNFAPYSQAAQEIAGELGAFYIDLPQIIQEQEISLDSFLAEDGLHLSRMGNYLYADMIFTALLPLLTEESTPLSYSLAPLLREEQKYCSSSSVKQSYRVWAQRDPNTLQTPPCALDGASSSDSFSCAASRPSRPTLEG
jgi:hypothetical protein